MFAAKRLALFYEYLCAVTLISYLPSFLLIIRHLLLLWSSNIARLCHLAVSLLHIIAIKCANIRDCSVVCYSDLHLRYHPGYFNDSELPCAGVSVIIWPSILATWRSIWDSRAMPAMPVIRVWSWPALSVC